MYQSKFAGVWLGSAALTIATIAATAAQTMTEWAPSCPRRSAESFAAAQPWPPMRRPVREAGAM